MKWFKHSVTASLELPVSQILAQYGYYGVGVFWTIMERVCMSEGQFTVADLQRQFANKGFGANKVKEIILGFGAFKLDAHARVSPAESDENPQSDCGTIAKRSQKVPPSNARTYNNKTRKDKEKDEDDNKRSSSSTSGPIRIEDPDAEPLKEAVLAKNGQHPLHMYEEGFINAPVLKPEWFADMKAKFGAKSEQLEKYWTDVVDIFRREYVCKGLWDKPVTEGMAYNYLYHFVCLFQDTKAMVLEAINQYSEHDRKQTNDDFMSTYFGPPLPDNAPPRPSHTAYFNFGSDKWEEPRVIKGKPNPNFHFNQ